GYGKTRCSLTAGGSSGRPSPASRGSCSEGAFANRSGSGVRASSRYGEPLDGTRETRRTSGAEGPTSRPASGFAIETASSSHDGAAHYQRLSGPVKLAVRAVDPGSGARVAVAKVRCVGFGVEGRAPSGSLGIDRAESGVPRVRRKSGRH